MMMTELTCGSCVLFYDQDTGGDGFCRVLKWSTLTGSPCRCLPERQAKLQEQLEMGFAQDAANLVEASKKGSVE